MSDAQALGGFGEGDEAGDGGDGGAGILPAGETPLGNSDSGGGGGGVGRVRINATTAPTLSGLVSPPQSTGAFTVGFLPVAAP